MVDGALALAGVRIYERAARAYDGNGGGPRLERVHRTSHPPPCRIPPSSPRKRLADRPACKRILAAPPPFRLARMVGWVGMVARGGRLLEPAIGPAPCTGLPRCSAGACTCNAAQHREVDGTELHFAEPRAGGTERDAHRGRPYRAERFENLRCGWAGGLVVGAGSRPVCLHARAWGCMEQVHTPSNPVKHHALNVVRPTLGVSSL